ncbi:LysM peptidoglycan-binding domain-containing protein [Candidatus Fermentibacterales bacterium]|nr:LysM peptidoglycan-binding domain-containing protein [Candidatus Fermentibacterales bacterium]
MLNRICLSLVAVGLLVLALPSGEAIASAYVVQQGDTLWDLASRFYRDPEYWKVIWEANAGIRDPHWIYPGDVIVLPNYSAGYESVSLSASTVAQNEAIIARLRIETAGMVAVDPLVPQGYVVELDAEEDHDWPGEYAYTGDLLHTDIGSEQGASVNDVFQILDKGEEVLHPNTGDRMGDLVRVAGICRLVEVGQEGSVALVEHCYLPILPGQILVDYTPASAVVVNTEPVLPSLSAWVIGLQDPDCETAYMADVVYIDRGSNDDLRPGDMFSAYRYGDVQSSPGDESVRTLDVPIADLVVLSTESSTAAALVCGNITSNLIEVGDRIHLVRRQQT